MISLDAAVIAAIVSGVFAVSNVFIQLYFANRERHSMIKYDILKAAYGSYCELGERHAAGNDIPKDQEGIRKFFSDSLDAMYSISKKDFDVIRRIHSQTGLALPASTDAELSKEIERIERLDYRLYATALVNTMGGIELITKSGITTDPSVNLLDSADIPQAMRDYIDSVQSLKEKLRVELANELKKNC
jgi:hypothetical protein